MKMIPPEGFRPAKEVVRESIKFFNEAPRWTKRKHRLTGAQKAGLAYEKKVHRSLGYEYGGSYRKKVWIEAVIDGQERGIEIDGLLVTDQRITIIEIKLRHTIRAWWQLRQLYQPVIAAAFPDHTIQVCEMYQHWDASVMIPEEIQHCPGDPGCDSMKYKLSRRAY